jgi:hypothetical protein
MAISSAAAQRADPFCTGSEQFPVQGFEPAQSSELRFRIPQFTGRLNVYSQLLIA